MSGDELSNSLYEHMAKERAKAQDRDYLNWCNELARLPPKYAPKLKGGLIADIELQPMRWMRAGLDLIQSAKGILQVHMPDGTTAPAMQTYLPYPVFQAGTEIFLKGMWLAPLEECRVVGWDDYVPAEVREKYRSQLKNLGHDLLDIIERLQKIPLYQEEGNISCFLRIISGVTRQHYYPLTENDSAWGHARYPRRFYNDVKEVARADQMKTYPLQWLLERLFVDTMHRVDRLWGITKGLAKRVMERRL